MYAFDYNLLFIWGYDQYNKINICPLFRGYKSNIIPTIIINSETMVKIIIDGNPYEIDEATKNIMEYIAEVDTVEGSAKEEVLSFPILVWHPQHP